MHHVRQHHRQLRRRERSSRIAAAPHWRAPGRAGTLPVAPGRPPVPNPPRPPRGRGGFFLASTRAAHSSSSSSSSSPGSRLRSAIRRAWNRTTATGRAARRRRRAETRCGASHRWSKARWRLRESIIRREGDSAPEAIRAIPARPLSVRSLDPGRAGGRQRGAPVRPGATAGEWSAAPASVGRRDTPPPPPPRRARFCACSAVRGAVWERLVELSGELHAMTISRFMAFLACGAMLALGACSNSRTVATDALDEAHEEEHRRATDELARVTAALNVLHTSLRNAQAALEAVGSGANARARRCQGADEGRGGPGGASEWIDGAARQPRQDGGHRGGDGCRQCGGGGQGRPGADVGGGGGYFLRQYAHEAGPGAGGAG